MALSRDEIMELRVKIKELQKILKTMQHSIDTSLECFNMSEVNAFKILGNLYLGMATSIADIDALDKEIN